MGSVSVAMATYNGEKYIEKQLDSLRNQTRNVDEVIISDDGSTDKTLDIVANYISKYNLFNWHFNVNNVNIGFIENFKRAISMTTGDYIFLADQDDEWYSDKVETMSEILDNDSSIDILACSLDAIDEDGKKYVPKSPPRWYNYLTKILDGKIVPIDFISIAGSNKFPGCTMCIRRNIAMEYLEYKFSYEIEHDWLMALLACRKGKCCFIHKPLIGYRIHPNSAIGLNKGRRADTVEEQIKKLENLRERYLVGKSYDASNSEQLDKNIKYVENRIIFYKERGFRNFINLISSSKKIKNLYANVKLINVKDLLYLLHLFF